MTEHTFPPIRSVVGYSPYLWPHAVAALRVVRPIQQAGLQYISGKEADRIDIQQVSAADVIVIQREFPLFWDEYEQILSLARQHGKPIVYEIDDLLLEIPEIHPDRAIDFYTPAILPILHAITSADLVTTTTPNLKKYLEKFNPNVYVLPNFLDDAYWELRPYRPSSEQAQVVIGFMGSDTHLPDLESISQVFLQLAEQYRDRVGFRFWGCQPPAAILKLTQTEWLPYQVFDYPKFASYFLQQDVDILIAPLVDSPFNLCKSNVKLLEYAAIATPGVYSRIDSYNSLIIHQENGFLASSQEEWMSYLSQLIENPALREQVGNRLQDTVRKNWLLSHNAQRWKQAYEYAQIVAMRGDMSHRAEQIRFLRSAASQTLMLIRKQDQKVAQLEKMNLDLQNQLNGIYSSRGWDLLQTLRRLRGLILPGSKRI